MAKEVMTPQEEALAQAQSQAENFFEKNSKMVVAAIVAIFAIAIVVFGYKKLVSEPRMNKAQEMLYEAQYLFEEATPDYSLALNGDESTPGFAEVAEQYGNTPAGNLANMYAAACALRLGDFDSAEKYINSYKNVKGIPGEMVNAMAEGIKGDIAVEKEEYAKAASLFEKAAKISDNNFTAPLYLRKAALAHSATGNEAKAQECYKTISEKYPSSVESRDAQKQLAE